MSRRKNPSTPWLLLGIGGAAVAFLWWRSHRARSAYTVDSSGRVVLRPDFDPSKGPPPPLSESQRAAMERAYRYRFAGGGRCFDYKERKFVDASYCR